MTNISTLENDKLKCMEPTLANSNSSCSSKSVMKLSTVSRTLFVTLNNFIEIPAKQSRRPDTGGVIKHATKNHQTPTND